MSTNRKRARDASPTSRPTTAITSSPGRANQADNLAPISSLPPFSEPEDVFDEQIDDAEETGLFANDLPDDEDLGGDEIDLFDDNLERDYKENSRLDVYDAENIDDEGDFEAMDIRTRQLAEARMARRDREEARRAGRLPAAYLDDEEDEDLALRRRRRHRGAYDADAMILDEEEIGQVDEEILAPNAQRGVPLNEYVMMDGPRQALRKAFHEFLTQFVDDKQNSVYGERIKRMCESNGESLEVSFAHMYESKAILAYYVANAPTEVLKIFDAVAYEVTLEAFENYDRIKSEVHVRISDLPDPKTLRDLRQIDLNTLVRVNGVVTRRTTVFPQLKYVKFECVKCSALLGPFYQDSTSDEIRIQNCANCESKGPFIVNSEETVYRNYQKITLQETPGTVPAGRLPRHREVILLWDLVDSVRPGEEIEVTGVYRNNFDVSLNTKNGFPVFATVLEANHILRKGDQFATFRLTEDDQRAIRALSRDPKIVKRIIKSIAPSIHGHEDIKTGIALAMFGGVPKNPQQKHKIRGDINVLALGDPGTAKSQFLKYVEKTAHRAVFTTGQGASAVGLTASVRKDPITREWTLEGGALVLADKGICLIDEFDKMNDQDRTSIHEAMEQQSISISKAGIVTTLQARCSVIAAANPIGGRYNTQIPFSQNVDLTEPILSRFDILCVVKDRVDPMLDNELAKFVVNSHVRSHPNYDPETDTALTRPVDPEIIDQEMLRKYLVYARDKIVPRIAQVDQDKIAALYAELRKQSEITGAIPITVRHLESIIRMSEASARMRLSEWVRDEDVNLAIRVMIESFIQAQKHSVTKALRKNFARYITYARDAEELLFSVLQTMLNDELKTQLYNRDLDDDHVPDEVAISSEEFELRARELRVNDVSEFYESRLFEVHGYRYDAENKVIVKSIAG